MSCEKCGGHLNSSGKCTICGYNREAINAVLAMVKEKQLQKRSSRLILFTTYQTIACLTILLSSLFLKPPLALLTLIIIFAVTRIVVIVFVFLYRKWAFYLLVGGYVIYCIFEAIVYQSFISIIFDLVINIALYYWIVSKDWHKFK